MRGYKRSSFSPRQLTRSSPPCLLMHRKKSQVGFSKLDESWRGAITIKLSLQIPRKLGPKILEISDHFPRMYIPDISTKGTDRLGLSRVYCIFVSWDTHQEKKETPEVGRWRSCKNCDLDRDFREALRINSVKIVAANAIYIMVRERLILHTDSAPHHTRYGAAYILGQAEVWFRLKSSFVCDTIPLSSDSREAMMRGVADRDIWRASSFLDISRHLKAQKDLLKSSGEDRNKMITKLHNGSCCACSAHHVAPAQQFALHSGILVVTHRELHVQDLAAPRFRSQVIMPCTERNVECILILIHLKAIAITVANPNNLTSAQSAEPHQIPNPSPYPTPRGVQETNCSILSSHKSYLNHIFLNLFFSEPYQLSVGFELISVRLMLSCEIRVELVLLNFLPFYPHKQPCFSPSTKSSSPHLNSHFISFHPPHNPPKSLFCLLICEFFFFKNKNKKIWGFNTTGLGGLRNQFVVHQWGLIPILIPLPLQKKLAQLPAVDMQHAPAKLPSKIHLLVESLLKNGWSNNRSFLGVSGCQLQAVDQVSVMAIYWRFSIELRSRKEHSVPAECVYHVNFSVVENFEFYFKFSIAILPVTEFCKICSIAFYQLTGSVVVGIKPMYSKGQPGLVIPPPCSLAFFFLFSMSCCLFFSILYSFLYFYIYIFFFNITTSYPPQRKAYPHPSTFLIPFKSSYPLPWFYLPPATKRPRYPQPQTTLPSTSCLPKLPPTSDLPAISASNLATLHPKVSQQIWDQEKGKCIPSFCHQLIQTYILIYFSLSLHILDLPLFDLDIMMNNKRSRKETRSQKKHKKEQENRKASSYLHIISTPPSPGLTKNLPATPLSKKFRNLYSNSVLFVPPFCTQCRSGSLELRLLTPSEKDELNFFQPSYMTPNRSSAQFPPVLEYGALDVGNRLQFGPGPDCFKFSLLQVLSGLLHLLSSYHIHHQ
ncbi:hypothetical protein VP01_74g5 [Puccinia sorghi]|uniref:Uncharacterized protein n=1 Tax=Puccinia sorghi TaxID=27349 RepID=A0A0L6UD44_9BASI|nr:hypothetical protein VP01_74g5 [Puccinia sorghi]